MHCTTVFNTDGPVSRKVGDQITSESKKSVVHALIEPLHQDSNISRVYVVILDTISIIYTQLQTVQFAKLIIMSKVWTLDRVIF